MKLTKTELKQLIKEALEEELSRKPIKNRKLREAAGKLKIPAPYNKYFTFSDYVPDHGSGEYEPGDEIQGYDVHLLAYLDVKPEYEEIFDGVFPVLVDDPECPVVEIVGDRMYDIDLDEFDLD